MVNIACQQDVELTKRNASWHVWEAVNLIFNRLINWVTPFPKFTVL